MSYSPLDSNKLKVGDPISKSLLDQINFNLIDHEDRINSLQNTGGTVHVLNGDFSFLNFSISSPNIFYYTARQNFSVNDFRVRLFTKGSTTSGTLSFVLEKSANPNNANFNTILTQNLSFNLATDADYAEKVASINSVSNTNNLVTGEILRIRVVSHPVTFKESVLISIGAQ